MSDPTLARAYRPGSWFGILGDRAMVLLPPSEKHRVGALWELVDSGAGFDEVLDALISGGLRELPGFVLVSEFEADTKVVVRGTAAATFTTADGEVRIAGTEATTWVERTMSGVTGLTVDVSGGDEPGGADYVIGSGLVRVSRVSEPAPAIGVADPAPSDPGLPDPDLADPPPGPETEAFGFAAPRLPEAPSAPEPADTADHPVTVDHDGETRAGGPSLPPPPQPGIPGQPPAPSVTRPVARLLISHGETVEVDRAVLVGRAPEARRFPALDQPRLVTVPSPNLEISSTHLEVRPGSGADHGSAVVTDLGSTNGTVLTQPGLGPEDLQPGVAVQLVPGAVIDLGDGLTIRVINP